MQSASPPAQETVPLRKTGKKGCGMGMVTVRFHPLDEVGNDRLKYAVIAAWEDGGWLFCRHRRRETWEMPGGHREPGETILQAARRELWEETGVTEAAFTPVSLYSVFGADGPGQTAPNYGMLYLARVLRRGPLPRSEMAEVRVVPVSGGALAPALPLPNTYPLIQPLLWERAMEAYAAGAGRSPAE